MIGKLQITPGPWKSRSRDQHVYGPAGVQVAFCGENGIYGDESYTIGKNESYNNARLAAAAPVMFLWIYEMMYCAEKNDMQAAAKLLDLGHELIKDAVGMTMVEIRERINGK